MFSIYSPLICIMFLFHSIQYIWIQFNSSCMQSHLIFSFEWNWISTKSILFFYQLIITSGVHKHRAQMNKEFKKVVYEYIMKFHLQVPRFWA
jgi:hypothetical protein